MKIYRFLIMAAMLPFALAAAALDVNTTAGKLDLNVGSNLDIESLKITGTIDASDFNFIADDLHNLKSIDLSGATIVAYNGKRTLSGTTEYPADVLPPYALFGSTASTIVLPTNITEIGESALAASDITEIAIPTSVKVIGDNAFAACSKLEAITIPATVTVLGNNLFINCTALTSAAINAPVADLGVRTFDGCTALKTVTIPSSVKNIGERAFNDCSSLESITLPSGLQTIGAKSFMGTALTSLNFTNLRHLNSIGDFAYANCDSLQSVSFGDNTVTLGRGVFFKDKALRSVSLPASLTVIPSFTFTGTTSIDANTVLPESLNEIGDYALTGWSHVREFILPQNTQHLGEGAMADWTNLKQLDVTYLTAIPTIGANVWENVDQANAILYVSSDMLNAYKSAAQWQDFKVTVKTTDSGSNVVIPGTEPSSVDFSFDGPTLVITSSEFPIVNVDIYDLNGRRHLSQSDSSTHVLVDTSAWDNIVMIVDVTLENNSHAVIKITR